jgi:hypothetical protein
MYNAALRRALVPEAKFIGCFRKGRLADADNLPVTAKGAAYRFNPSFFIYLLRKLPC